MESCFSVTKGMGMCGCVGVCGWVSFVPLFDSVTLLCANFASLIVCPFEAKNAAQGMLAFASKGCSIRIAHTRTYAHTHIHTHTYTHTHTHAHARTHTHTHTRPRTHTHTHTYTHTTQPSVQAPPPGSSVASAITELLNLAAVLTKQSLPAHYKVSIGP